MLVVLADNHAIVREAIAHIIHENHNLEVVQADSAGMAVQLCKSRCPALVLLESTMPGLSAFAAATEIHRMHPRTRIAILTSDDHPSNVLRVRRFHLNGFILKKDNPSELDYAIKTLLSGGFYISPSMSNILLEQPDDKDPLEALTFRERVVLTLYAQGFSIKEIANELNVSVKTAETHRNNFGRKLGHPNRSQVTAFALQHHLITNEQLAVFAA
jgi:DNA-binding NarL/FixJ family response regulator